MAVRQMLVAGRYRLLEPVGAGGMGRVWLARDQMLDRDVAVKEIVPPDWMSDAEKDRLHSRTLREARSAARLTHPHVVRVYDVVHAEGLSWIVMEYVASRSLYQVLTTKGPYRPIEAARIGLAVLDALTAAHHAGVLHRDVKPHNVLIGSDGRVLLTDFGLATFVDDGMITTPGLIVGSPQYVSPERARDGASTVESDLWSFGATLYATVEGRSPYARDSAMATLAALATEDPDPPLRAGPLAPILEGLLRYEPGARLSAAEAERQLRLVLGEEPAGPPHDPGPDRPVTRRPPAEPAADTEQLAGTADLDTPNLTESDQPLSAALPVPAVVRAISSAVVPIQAGPGPADDGSDVAGSDAGPGAAGSDVAGSGTPEFGAPGSAAARSHAADSGVLGAADEKSGKAGDSDDWWHSPDESRGSDDLIRSRYIEGTFTTGALTWAGAHRGAGANQGPNHAGPPGPRPNRAPAAAGQPATSASARRGNQVLLRAIPAPRSPVSGPLHSNEPPPGRWTRRQRPVNRVRTRLVIAGLLATVLVVGGLLGARLIARENSAPQVVKSPAPSLSVSSSLSRASPSRASPSPSVPASPLTAGFSPVVCDVRPPSRVPVAPKKDAARGVNGWELQTGWSYFTDGTGFHLPVPDGWSYQRIGTTYCFRDPRGARVLSLDVARPAGTDPQEGCRAEERRLRRSGRVRGYTSITISPVDLLHAAADWDYRYRTAAGVLRRATTRWFVAGARAYALGWATPERAWAGELGKIEMVRATFYTDTPPAGLTRD
jgi:eukaryotic-like serine/threonine-protein kinase